jgi:hypothetical protein
MNTKVVATNTQPLAAGAKAKVVNVRLTNRSGRYRIEDGVSPVIKHDAGFLGRFSPEKPTSLDRLQLAAWRAKLEGAEALRPDLADATAAYRHFLDGNGADRQISYERYVGSDPSGQKTLTSILNDFKHHASVIGVDREDFEITSDPYALGSDSSFFPYPATENWQKAIGAHFGWVTAKVHVHTDKADLKDVFVAEVVIHIEDKYNFNPGAADIATGIPDSDNGRFEITGLAHQYKNRATLRRSLTWKEGDGKDAAISGEPLSRERRPSDNRRLRNRV